MMSESPRVPIPIYIRAFYLLHFHIHLKILAFSFSLSLSVIGIRPELAHYQGTLEEEDSSNRGVVLCLYEAIGSRDVKTVKKVLAPDLEWWFHGPPTHQFLMRILTGAKSADKSFKFLPESIDSFGPTVLVEGSDQRRSISWVHAWTVSDGMITQVREYFNTSLTVTRVGNPSDSPSPSEFSRASSSTSSRDEITLAASPNPCISIWENSLADQGGKSVPGLVLAL